MRNLKTILTAVVMALFICGCATPTGGEAARVKCPQCGYEFNAPSDN